MVYHDISQEQLLLLITQAVQAELQKRSRQVPVGISVRHIHLTRDDVDKLFGYGYQLTPKKALSQPGQFACEECLDIIGAGVGEMVLVTTDETTQHGLDHPSPIDAFIVGIVDNPPTLSK